MTIKDDSIMKIKDVVKNIKARQIVTSRGTLTVEVEFVLEHISFYSSVPSGKSTGRLEAKIFVDPPITLPKIKFRSSLDTFQCVVSLIQERVDLILNTKMMSPDEFDIFLINLDGTKDKSRFGANFILPLSICYCKVYAYFTKQSIYEMFLKNNKCHKSDITNLNKRDSQIPIAHFNVLNGGLHSGNDLECQEIMLTFDRPTFTEQLKCSLMFFEALGSKIAKKYGKIFTAVGEEGGYCPPIETLEEALNLIMSTAKDIEMTGFKIALDMAANSFYKIGDQIEKDNKNYCINNKNLSSVDLINMYLELINSYPIYSIEDPFAEDDTDTWELFYKRIGYKINIVADDLTVTNTELISKYHCEDKKLFNTVLIKPNQIGSVTETINAINMCKNKNIKTMISHRSGETEDTFIADFAVGVQAEYIKAGAPCRGERTCKYNQLLRIEEAMMEKK